MFLRKSIYPGTPARTNQYKIIVADRNVRPPDVEDYYEHEYPPAGY